MVLTSRLTVEAWMPASLHPKKGDVRKTVLWLTLPNPMLGNVSPRDMIRFGRYKRLSKFIANALSENRR
jgi:hypothetical protein